MTESLARLQSLLANRLCDNFVTSLLHYVSFTKSLKIAVIETTSTSYTECPTHTHDRLFFQAFETLWYVSLCAIEHAVFCKIAQKA